MSKLPRLVSILFGLGAVAVNQPTPAATLAVEQRSGFFQWFHLEESCPPVATSNGQTWRCFRPSGGKFHALVELDVLTDGQGGIVASQLGLDRAFIDGGNAPFARDIAKSYLGWALPGTATDFTGLVRNIADVSQAGGTTIILHRDAAAEPPGPDITGGYQVFIGVVPSVSVTRQGVALTMANVPGAFPTRQIFATGPGSPRDKRWLRITIQPSG